MFRNGSTAMEGLSGRASGSAVSVGGFVVGEELGPMRTRQARIGSAIFFKDCEPISSKVLSTLPRTCRWSIVGNANPTRLCDPFETHCNIDPITKDIIVCDDNITDVNADAKFDPFVLRHIGILFRHAALDFVGTSQGIDHACELDESAVSGVLDDASAMISDFGIKKRLSKSFQLRQRAFFVDPYQAARACDIRRQNSRQSPLYVLAAQDAPPKAWGN